ncbi:MAG: Trp family transcriptional regulator [Patescibacteria group bacterium]
MAHTSKKKLAPNTAETIGDYFLMSVVHARTKRDAYALIKELLGKEERIVLAKRLAIIVMLVRSYSAPQIEELLKVSPDTVGRIVRDMKKGRYAHVIRYAKNNSKKFEGESFLDLLEKLLEAGVLPLGRGRWDAFKRGARQSEYYDS